MGISPPTQNAPTEVTESASRVAAPASAAFPPCSRILMPAAVAAGLPETTTPRLPAATLGPRRVTGVLVACGQTKVATKKSETDDIEMILRISITGITDPGTDPGSDNFHSFRTGGAPLSTRQPSTPLLTKPGKHSPEPSSDQPCSRKPGQTPTYLKP